MLSDSFEDCILLLVNKPLLRKKKTQNSDRLDQEFKSFAWFTTHNNRISWIRTKRQHREIRIIIWNKKQNSKFLTKQTLQKVVIKYEQKEGKKQCFTSLYNHRNNEHCEYFKQAIWNIQKTNNVRFTFHVWHTELIWGRMDFSN
jgi:hypothetical protein